MTPIVLIPGLLCTAEVYTAYVPALSPHGPVTIASTLEGDSMASIAAAILRDAPPTFALAGISMGGYLCFEILRRAPERVTKLALLDTSARPDTKEQTADRRALVAHLRGGGSFSGVLTPLLAALVHPDHVHDARLREIHLRMAETVGLEGFARQQEAIIGRPDSRPGLSAISVPTLVLVGDSDKLTPQPLAEEMAAAIPEPRLVVVPTCGHSSLLEQPEAVSRALVDWIAR